MMVSQKIHAYYQLPPPPYPKLIVDTIPTVLYRQSWPEDVLSLYNPLDETYALKQADNKQTAFQSLRKAHKNRHDFRNARVY